MKIETVLELKHSNLELDPLVKAQLTFIIKEINNNIAKHAHASFCILKLKKMGIADLIF